MLESSQRGESKAASTKRTLLRPRPAAFTLLELLVVIAIIGILARCFCRFVSWQAKGPGHLLFE